MLTLVWRDSRPQQSYPHKQTKEPEAVNILLATPHLAYPQDTGSYAAQFSMLKAHLRHCNIRLIYKAQTRKDTENTIKLENQLENLKVLLCDPVS